MTGDRWTAPYRAHSHVDYTLLFSTASPIKTHYYYAHFSDKDTEALASQGLV